jgi:hypothetical protein
MNGSRTHTLARVYHDGERRTIQGDVDEGTPGEKVQRRRGVVKCAREHVWKGPCWGAMRELEVGGWRSLRDIEEGGEEGGGRP